jgi:glycosyltransferase involved in cell wall biosynthesis
MVRQMRIWTICAGEPLPTDENQSRPMRVGMLVRVLRDRGHDVVWWTSSFDHSAKRHRTVRSGTLISCGGVRLKLLQGIRYSRNVSVARLVNHYQLARQFESLSDSEPKPRVIFCCWPTIELGCAAVTFAERHRIPIILDVRDLWPDLYLDTAPRFVRGLSKLLMLPYWRMTKFAFGHASAIVGISERYLEWGLLYAGRGRHVRDAIFPLGYSEPEQERTPTAEEREWLRALGVDESRTLCWFLGSFGNTYDLESVILAARQLEASGLTDCQFILSGEGEKRSRYESLARGLKNVTFTGWLNTERIACLMQVAHIGLAAYRRGARQGLPNKIFEYMAAGLPILSSLTGECQRFLDANDCGISYSAGSPDSLARALLSLTRDPALRQRLGSNGLRVFQRRYSASVIYPELADYLEQMGEHPDATESL